jgi:AcrR family transcriptional regulator
VSVNPGRPRNAETDVAILDAALDLLIERGVTATSIERVAQRAGVTRATVYRRYRDKVELLGAAVEAAYGDPPPSPEIRDVEHLLTGWSQILGEPRQRKLLRRLYGSVDDCPELVRAYRNSLQVSRDRARRDVLERARARSQFPRDADVDVILQVLSGAVWQHLLAHPDTSGPRDVERFLTAVLKQTGYRPANSRARPSERSD